MKTLSNKQRASESDANIQRKLAYIVELVEKISNGEDVPKGIYPTNISQFREFEDLNLGLKRIGSPKLLNKKSSPSRASLIDEIEINLGKLSSFKSAYKKPPKKPSLSNQLESLKAERNDLKYLVGRLLSQVALLLDENRILKENEYAAEITKYRTNKTIKELNQKVVRLGGTLLKKVASDE